MLKIVFVGGIHGAGKTTLGRVVARQLGYPHYSAGNLIGQIAKGQTGEKVVKNVDANQDLLLAAVNGLPAESTILDGHFCLLRSGQNVEPVPLRTFVSLAPICVIVVQANVLEIAKRLHLRDGRQYDMNLLEQFQAQELKRAQAVCDVVSAPIICVNSEESGRAADFVRQVLKRTC